MTVMGEGVAEGTALTCGIRGTRLLVHVWVDREAGREEEVG